MIEAAWGDEDRNDRIDAPFAPAPGQDEHGPNNPYPVELRREAGLRCLLGERAEDVARDYGCTSQSVYGWARKLRKEMEQDEKEGKA